MVKALSFVVILVAALLASGASPAMAYPDQGSYTLCDSGPSGKVCIHVETDAGSDHIRARGAADVSGDGIITIKDVVLTELVVNLTTGERQTYNKAINLNRVTANPLDTPVSEIAGPVIERCDTSQYLNEWSAYMDYDTNFTGDHPIQTPYVPGRC